MRAFLAFVIVLVATAGAAIAAAATGAPDPTGADTFGTVIGTAGPWAQFGAFGLFAFVLWQAVRKIEDRFTTLVEKLSTREEVLARQHGELVGLLERVLDRTPLTGSYKIPPSPFGDPPAGGRG